MTIGNEDKHYTVWWQLMVHYQLLTLQRQSICFYTDQLNYYFIANEITTGKKEVAILLSACGKATFKTISSLVDAGTLKGTKHNDLTKVLSEYYSISCIPRLFFVHMCVKIELRQSSRISRLHSETKQVTKSNVNQHDQENKERCINSAWKQYSQWRHGGALARLCEQRVWSNPSWIPSFDLTHQLDCYKNYNT